MKNLLKMSDLSPAELTQHSGCGRSTQGTAEAGRHGPAAGRKDGCPDILQASTRTRTSFEAGCVPAGRSGQLHEHRRAAGRARRALKDTAGCGPATTTAWCGGTYRQSDLEEFAELAGVPVINGLTDYAHPCQVLADLMTIRERRGSLAGRKLCFVGDGSSMANSLIVGGLLAGMQVTCVCPQSYRPAADVLMFAHKYGSAST